MRTLLSLCIGLFLMTVGLAQQPSEQPATITTNRADGASVTITLDHTGRPAENTVYNPDGPLRHRTVFERDDQARVRQATTYDARGNVLRTESYEYDSRGLPISVRRVDADGRVTLRVETFNEVGQATGSKYLDADEKAWGSKGMGELALGSTLYYLHLTTRGLSLFCPHDMTAAREVKNPGSFLDN